MLKIAFRKLKVPYQNGSQIFAKREKLLNEIV